MKLLILLLIPQLSYALIDPVPLEEIEALGSLTKQTGSFCPRKQLQRSIITPDPFLRVL